MKSNPSERPPEREPNNESNAKILEIVNNPYILEKLSKLPPGFTNFLAAVFVFLGGGLSTQIYSHVADDSFEGFEEKIKEADLKKACEAQRKLLNQSIPDQNKKFVATRLVLKEDPEVWKAFQWKCLHQIEEKLVDKLPKVQEVYIGLTLDDFCNDNSKIGSKAFPKDFKDPHSIHCTDVNPDPLEVRQSVRDISQSE